MVKGQGENGLWPEGRKLSIPAFNGFQVVPGSRKSCETETPSVFSRFVYKVYLFTLLN